MSARHSHSPARAIAWEIGYRNRWGLLALCSYLLVFAAVDVLFLPEAALEVDPPNGWAGLLIAPITIAFFWFVAVFTLGISGDLTARQSIFPARMFALPVSTAALAGWPMLYGTIASSLLWLLAVVFVYLAGGVTLPLWPAFLLAVFLAWIQVFTWMPYGIAGMRVAAAMLWLVTLDAAVLVAIHFELPESVMIAALAPQLPLAYVAGRLAVARARRGDTPDWRAALERATAATKVGRSRTAFRSPARAQLWFEWRRHGRALPATVAAVLPFELALLFMPGAPTPAYVELVILCVLFTPPFMAAIAGPRASYSVSSFTATRPLTSATLAASKLKMTLLSSVITWLLVIICTPAALQLSGTWAMAVEPSLGLARIIGMPRAVVLLSIAFLALMSITWKQLVIGLYIGLTGRAWVARLYMTLAVVLIIVIGPVLQTIIESGELRGALWREVPMILAMIVGIRLAALAWIAARYYRTGLVSDRTILAAAGSWVAAVCAVYFTLVWLFDTPFVAHYVLMLIAILAVPFVRISATPLALAWSRHQ